MEGGELFQRISDRVDGPFTERGMNNLLCVEFNCISLEMFFHYMKFSFTLIYRKMY